MIPLDYVEREQTLNRHSLLKAYLQSLFMVIGKREATINYIACLTRPWQQRGEDIRDTPVAVSMDTMQECHHELNGVRKYVQFRGLFVEKNKKPFAKLEKFLQSKSWAGTKTHCMNGDFYELRRDILSWCGKGDLCLFFIDPTEWKQSALPTLSPFLKRPRSEFLVNFNFDFFLRAHPEESLEEQVRTILGTSPDTSVMEPKEKEEFLLNLYCRKLKSVRGTGGDKLHCGRAKVLYSARERTVHDLVYLGGHPLGLIAFMEIAEELEPEQRVLRARSKQDKRIKDSGQLEIFSADKLIKDNDKVLLPRVKEYWLSKLSHTPKRFGVVRLADMLEETGWFVGDFQRAFAELESEEKVKNLGSSAKRPINPVHFRANGNNGELLLKI